MSDQNRSMLIRYRNFVDMWRVRREEGILEDVVEMLDSGNVLESDG